MAPLDWNGNGRKDTGDYYIDYEIFNDIYNDTESNSYSGGRRVKNKKYTEDEHETNWVIIRVVFIILGLFVGAFGFIVNFLSLFGGYVSWMGLIVCPIVLILIIRYLKKNGWPKKR